MMASNGLSELLTTVFDRRTFVRKTRDSRQIKDLCLALLAEKTEAPGMQVASTVLNKYRTLDAEQKAAFFAFLNDELDLDGAAIADLALAYQADPSPENFKALCKAAEPRRQELFRKLNEAPGATAEIVKMRKDFLPLLKTTPELGRTDQDMVHLLRSWFNRGFLVMRQITWDTPASILEKIIAYEAVHEIHTWDDLRRRLHPEDRRCFAFFHPAMPDEPLIFVEVALTKSIPNSIQTVLSDSRTVLDETEADTAVFYSISNCQEGLAGISFGNSLIKQVARDLSHQLPNVKTFVTLSPIPGLMKWLVKEGLESAVDDPTRLTRLTALYLLEGKSAIGQPLDPVARFHLSNGALVHAVHLGADSSKNGIAQSAGVMVNYRYDLPKISQNAEQFAQRQEVAASSAVKTLARQAAKDVRA